MARGKNKNRSSKHAPNAAPPYQPGASIRTPTAEEKAAYNVELETRSLYELHQKMTREKAETKHAATKYDREFGQRSLYWFLVTGGWDKVDSSIRDRYPQTFHKDLESLGKGAEALKQMMMKGMGTGAVPILDISKPKPAKVAVQPQAPQPQAPKASTSSTSKQPFDVISATRALFPLSQKAILAPPPNDFEKLFTHLAIIWLKEAGGVSKIDKSILSP